MWDAVYLADLQIIRVTGRRGSVQAAPGGMVFREEVVPVTCLLPTRYLFTFTFHQ
jgi:hypothetical protein